MSQFASERTVERRARNGELGNRRKRKEKGEQTHVLAQAGLLEDFRDGKGGTDAHDVWGNADDL